MVGKQFDLFVRLCSTNIEQSLKDNCFNSSMDFVYFQLSEFLFNLILIERNVVEVYY